MDLLGSRDVRRFLRPMMQKKQRMNLREALPLAGITVSTFIFCTSEFMPVALLTDIALSFSVTESQAGMLISVYAWMVMLLSLPLMIAASRIGFRRLFLIIVALFAFGQLLSSLATSYFMLMAARIVVACAHAIFWSIAPPMAVRVVSEDHRHMALGMVVMGESVALIAGLPLGRVIGLALGWRMTFACVAIITVIIFIYLYFVLPAIPATKPFSVRRLPVLFKTKTLRSLYLFVGVMMTAYYMCYSYIEPYLLQSVGLEEQTVTVVIAFFGVAGILGSVLFSKIYARQRVKFLCECLLGLVTAFFVLFVSQDFLIGVLGACVVLGMGSTAMNAALQSEVIRYSSLDDQAVATSIFSAIFNFGIGSGSALGGVVTSCVSVGSIGAAAGALGLVAFLYCVIVLIPRLRIART